LYVFQVRFIIIQKMMGPRVPVFKPEVSSIPNHITVLLPTSYKNGPVTYHILQICSVLSTNEQAQI